MLYPISLTAKLIPPQTHITKIGFNLHLRSAVKAAKNRSNAPHLNVISPFVSGKTADIIIEIPAPAINATTAGLRLPSILPIAEPPLYRRYIYANNDTMIQDGKIQPQVATIAPGKPAIRIPTNVAEFTAIGPGVISAIVIRLANSVIVIHP